MEDFLGQKIDVGDRVIYAAMSGRSVNMVLAEVVRFNDSGSVTVQPLEAARWKQHYGATRWIDNRTGKGIDPYASSGKHIKERSHMVWEDTGERLTQDEVANYDRGPFPRRRRARYVPSVFHDYVEQVQAEPGPVTLTVTENIIKAPVTDG